MRYVQKAGMKWSKRRKDRKRTRGRVRERRPRLDGGRALTLPEVAVIASVHTSGLVDVGSVGRVRVDVVLVDGRSGVRLVDTGRVVDEGTSRANGRRSSVRVVVLGRGHGGDGSEVLLAGSALSAGAGEADGDSRPQLAAGGGNDEPDLRRDTNVGVGEAETVDSVAGDDEESEVELSRGTWSDLAHKVSRKELLLTPRATIVTMKEKRAKREPRIPRTRWVPRAKRSAMKVIPAAIGVKMRV